MGLGLWLACGLAAFVVARLIRAGRGRRWLGEMLLAVGASALLGLGATAFDFGGWREPDWRAGLFAFCGAFAMLGLLRAIRLARGSA